MRVALIGYGKMGKMIEAYALEAGHKVVAKIDPFAAGASHAQISRDSLGNADVAIEFSTPKSAVANIEAALAVGTPLVVGTTGWLGDLEKVGKMVAERQASLVYGANYSIGVNLFYKIVAEACKIMNGQGLYDVGGFEAHHNQKADSPSGTAKSLAKIVLANIDSKKRLVSESLTDRRPDKEEFHFSSLRLGSVPGTHSIIFDSSADSIELTHTARSREGFARGALKAAEWLAASGRKGLIPVEETLF